jgi:hypothetical protein
VNDDNDIPIIEATSSDGKGSCFFSSMMVISGAVSRGFLSYNMIGLIICVLALECHMRVISMCCYVK